MAQPTLHEKLDDLAEGFSAFQKQYHKDMHGDTNLDSGEIGIIGAIRELRKYPSITALWAQHPAKVACIVIGGFGLLTLLWGSGWLAAAAKIFGLAWPLAP